ncbi:hypothetical protein HPB50_017453 [Hyalomma asiaticum]|uniref:Uncharacterized protein n=1 Tax=Hyalomma asiaticum TaxID=266040 RepID=A0ACB7RQ78_HYAAI|nr:hypothetical protein HPB50_017453 [Hyalomma asiaticum]
MSSSQTDNSDDQQHASDSVEYSGVGGGVFPKRRGKVFLIVGLMSVVVVVIVFLIVGFVSYRDAATAQAHNAGPSQLAAANAENCANPCRSPHFFCHPASEKDDKGCFEPGCACSPCVLPVRGAFPVLQKMLRAVHSQDAPVNPTACPRVLLEGDVVPAHQWTRRDATDRAAYVSQTAYLGASPVLNVQRLRPGTITAAFSLVVCASLQGNTGTVHEPRRQGVSVSTVNFSSVDTELSPPRAGSLFPLGDDKALPIGVDQDFNSSIDFRYNRRVIPRNKSETTVDAVSVHGHTDPSADVSSHIPTPGETHTTGDVPVNSVNSSSEHQRPSVSAAVPVTHLGGTSSSDAKESPVQHSNASSPTLSHRATQIPDVDNASMTVSASQSTVETPAVTLPAVSGNVSDGSTSNVDDTPGTVNTSSPLDDDDDDDEDDGVLGNVGSEDSKDGNAQNTTLERRHDSENATLGKSDNAGAMEGGEQGSPRHETDSTFKTSEDTEDAASTISSQQAGEGHRSSTTVDHHASDATSEGTAQGHHTPLTAASEDIRN